MIRRLCPVCWQIAHPTTKGNIGRHMDSLRRDVCPGGSEPFRITLTAPPVRKRGVA